MNLTLTSLIATFALAGCGTAATSSAAPAEWQRVAPGVEIRVSSEAGVEAERIADEVRAKYAARLISAAPTSRSSWAAQ